LEPDERGVWYDLLNFAALSAVPGHICDKDNRPYPNAFIANRLNIPLALLESSLEKCKEEGRVRIDDKGIHITNWDKYQSEYERQKPYREAKKPDAPQISAAVLSKEARQAISDNALSPEEFEVLPKERRRYAINHRSLNPELYEE
jgi:hypothetical protein